MHRQKQTRSLLALNLRRSSTLKTLVICAMPNALADQERPQYSEKVRTKLPNVGSKRYLSLYLYCADRPPSIATTCPVI